jgi:hypothetical protein
MTFGAWAAIERWGLLQTRGRCHRASEYLYKGCSIDVAAPWLEVRMKHPHVIFVSRISALAGSIGRNRKAERSETVRTKRRAVILPVD